MARKPERVYPTNQPPRFYWEIWRDRSQGYVPYFWEELISQAMIFFLFLGVIGGLALLWPAGLDRAANSLITPVGTKPEWYFLALFQLIKIVPELLAFVLVGLVLVLMIALPFIDRSPERNPLRKPVTTTIGLLVVIALIVLTIWGAVVS